MKKSQPVLGFKGFDKDLKCRGFQFESGRDYKHEGNIEPCASGFHFCENPLDVLSYYPFAASVYAAIEALGNVKTENDKSVTDHIKIGAQLDLSALVKASVSFIWERASSGGILKKNSATSGNDANSATSGYGAHSATSGDRANSATSGDRANSATSGNGAHSATSGNDANSATSGNGAHSATSGDRANSATSGYGAHSATSGNDAIACSIGRKAAAKASIGCWIVLAEWHEGSEFTDAKPTAIKSVQVDGKKIKADVWYELKHGKFVESDTV